MTIKTGPLFLAVVSIALLGCNLFGKDFDSIEDEEDGPPIGPGAYQECEENSGYPCACDGLDVLCDDGSTCVILNKGDTAGLCSLGCSGELDFSSCTERKGYGVKAGCLVAVDSEQKNHCAVFCEADGMKGPCPAGLFCKDFGIGSVCLPPTEDELRPDTDTGPDTGLDTGRDTGLDTGQDTGESGCPVNSGWPCTCAQRDRCDNGDPCFDVDGQTGGEFGICSARCIGEPGFRSCPGTEYASDPQCRLGEKDQDPEYCTLVCDPDDSSEQCPPGQTCRTFVVDAVTGEELSICHP